MSDYFMGDSERERRRLVRQAERLRPNTLRLLQAAGLKPGDRVLDLGSGAGDVSFLAAEIVGPDGSVVGIDREPAQTEAARARAEQLGLGQIDFQTVELQAFEAAVPFDAVIGRLILIHTPDFENALAARVAEFVRPGGALAFHEYHWWRGWEPRIEPAAIYDDPVIRRAFALAPEVTEKVTGNTDMGVRLPPELARWGEPAATIVTPVAVGAAAVADALDFALDSIRSLMPAAVRLGLLPEGELDLDAALARARAVLAAHGDGPAAVETAHEVLACVRKRGPGAA